MRHQLNRRRTLEGLAGLALAPALRADLRDAPYNASGERVGEVTATSALVHARLTAVATRNNRGYSFPVHTHNLSTMNQLKYIRMPEGMRVAELEGACEGRAGRARLRFGLDSKLSGASATDWAEVGPATDFTHQFGLKGLEPASQYFYSLETTGLSGGGSRSGSIGRFRTAPAAGDWRPVRFVVLSCQDYGCRDHVDGFVTYESMNRVGADFAASVGDNVYYDLDLPFATTVDIARFHWHRMYSQPLVMDLFRNMSGYWLKDDHDSFEDDDWPSRPPQRVGPMTYQTLSPVFTEQVPMGPTTYRRARWGKGLEIWFTESRDFRSPNPDPDGPSKTIWGEQQKAWLKRTLLESDADFRILVSPNCLVGPDPGHGVVFKYPGGGADSHGDQGYGHEGREFRNWVRESKLNNFFVINGDRHWQYHSVDPETGLREFCCGAVTDSHSVKTERTDPKYHRFLRLKGGFISVELAGTRQEPRLAVRIHDVRGAVVFETDIQRG